MKRLRMMGLALLALFALGALVASSASAVEGVLPLNKKGFTILSKAATLETSNKEKIVCGETKGSGKFESDSHGSVTFDFLKCEAFGFITFSLAEEETTEVKKALILVPALFLICLIASLKFGIFVELKEPVHLIVKALGALINIKGSVIGEILTEKGELAVVDFSGKEGKQSVTECKDEAGNVKKADLKSEQDPKAALQASQSAVEGLVQFEEKVELMDT